MVNDCVSIAAVLLLLMWRMTFTKKIYLHVLNRPKMTQLHQKNNFPQSWLWSTQKAHLPFDFSCLLAIFPPGFFFCGSFVFKYLILPAANVSFKSRVLNRTGESFDSELYKRIGVAGCLGDAYGLQATVPGAQKHRNVFIVCKWTSHFATDK